MNIQVQNTALLTAQPVHSVPFFNVDYFQNEHEIAPKYEPLVKQHYYPESNTNWLSFSKNSPNNCTREFIDDMLTLQSENKKRQNLRRSNNKHEYLVYSSEKEGIFNLGGDLSYFLACMKNKDRDGLVQYGMDCIKWIYNNHSGHSTPTTTITLVAGSALGGGFEAALSSNILVAERKSTMGFPEVLFNLFPGMGAYQLLTQRIAPSLAERMILSGKTYTAEELYDMGVVDVLAEDGKGEQAVWDTIRRHQKQSIGAWGLRRLSKETNPLRYESLIESIEIWVDAAMSLADRDIKHMEYMIRAQSRSAR